MYGSSPVYKTVKTKMRRDEREDTKRVKTLAKDRQREKRVEKDKRAFYEERDED